MTAQFRFLQHRVDDFQTMVTAESGLSPGLSGTSTVNEVVSYCETPDLDRGKYGVGSTPARATMRRVAVPDWQGRRSGYLKHSPTKSRVQRAQNISLRTFRHGRSSHYFVLLDLARSFPPGRTSPTPWKLVEDFEVLLYDLASTYVEGDAEHNARSGTAIAVKTRRL